MNVNKLGIICMATTFSFLLLPSCSVSKKQVTKAGRYQIDSARVVKQDSMRYQRLLRASEQAEVYLHHITLSEPDSLGQQYPRTISVAELKQIRHLSQHDTLARQTSTDTRIHSEMYEVRNNKEATKKANFRFVYWAVSLVVLGCFIYCLCQIYKRIALDLVRK